MRNVCFGVCAGALFWCLGCNRSLGPRNAEAGKRIFSSSVEVFTAQNEGGGFTPPPPAGSTCPVGARRYVLVPASRGFAFTRCVGDGVAPYQEVSGGRVLSEAEYGRLLPLLYDLKVIKRSNVCIADAPVLSVTIKGPRGEKKYVDESAQCAILDTPLLDRGAIEKVLSRFDKLSGL